MNLDCQLGWICCHLGNRCLGMAIRVFPDFTKTAHSWGWRMAMRVFPEFTETAPHTHPDCAENHSWGWGSKMNKEEKEEGSWASVCVLRASGQVASLVPDFTAHALTWRITFFLKLWAKISHDSLRSYYTDFFVMVIKNISTMTFIYSVAFQVWIYIHLNNKNNH